MIIQNKRMNGLTHIECVKKKCRRTSAGPPENDLKGDVWLEKGTKKDDQREKEEQKEEEVLNNGQCEAK